MSIVFTSSQGLPNYPPDTDYPEEYMEVVPYHMWNDYAIRDMHEYKYLPGTWLSWVGIQRDLIMHKSMLCHDRSMVFFVPPYISANKDMDKI